MGHETVEEREWSLFGLNDFTERLGVSLASRRGVEREEENPPRDDLVERAAAILELGDGGD